VFGHNKQGTGTSASKSHLPAVKSFREWNNYVNDTGIKNYISRCLDDLKEQLFTELTTALEDYPEAKSVASYMQFMPQNFIADMSSWMDEFYHELITLSEYY
jgi:hypothetical protein